jgi:hypothetical protein
MKSSISQLVFLFSIFFLLVVVSCSEDSDPIDITAPTIELHDPVSGEYMEAGDYAHLEAMLTDDIELATYNLEIHENFDGHAHGRIAASNEDPSLIKWSFNQSFEVPSGLFEYEAVHEDEIEIPSNTLAGPYHYILQAIDASGNSTSYQDGSTAEIEIYITNDSQPVINITNLLDDELEIEVSTVFMVTGDVTDPTTGEYAGMHGMDIILGEGHEEDDHSHGRIASDDLINVSIGEETLDQFMVDGAIMLNKVFEDINFVLSEEQLDELIAEEIYHLKLTISVHDEQGNIAVSNTVVHLHTD